MTKLCPRGKAAAKRKFKVYPSAYANAYASKICAGKIKDPSGVKRKDFRGRKPAVMGGPMSTEIERQFKIQKLMGTGGAGPLKKLKDKLAEIKRDKAIRRDKAKVKTAKPSKEKPRRPDITGPRDPRRERRPTRPKDIPPIEPPSPRPLSRVKKAGGGLMEATARLKRQGLGMGGSVCKIAKRGMNRDAIGKNS